MHIKEAAREAPQQKKIEVPEMAVGFVGILLFILAQFICIGIHRFHQWRSKDKEQTAPNRNDTQDNELQPRRMVYCHNADQLPPYPDHERPPPPYVERPTAAHVLDRERAT